MGAKKAFISCVSDFKQQIDERFLEFTHRETQGRQQRKREALKTKRKTKLFEKGQAHEETLLKEERKGQ